MQQNRLHIELRQTPILGSFKCSVYVYAVLFLKLSNKNAIASLRNGILHFQKTFIKTNVTRRKYPPRKFSQFVLFLTKVIISNTIGDDLNYLYVYDLYPRKTEIALKF